MRVVPFFDSILATVGNTPMVRLSRLTPAGGADILAKLEYFNPMSSLKDRIALSMIEDAERRGVLRAGMTVVEPTSGNTGIGLAMVCAVKGYRLVLTMPETMSIERRKMLGALGAEIVLTSGKLGMKGAVEEARRLKSQDGMFFMPQQFENPANPMIHRETTAREILLQTDGRLDAFVAGVGTGGTITGVGELLLEHIPDLLVVAVEPADSPVLSGGAPGPHRIQGIGAGFVPGVLNRKIFNRVITVTESEAVSATKLLARREGIFAGISSGAALSAAMLISSELGAGKRVVVVLPDTGERYLSTGLFEVGD